MGRIGYIIIFLVVIIFSCKQEVPSEGSNQLIQNDTHNDLKKIIHTPINDSNSIAQSDTAWGWMMSYRVKLENPIFKYSKSFKPTISVDITNNWNTNLDVLILSIKLGNHESAIEKTIEQLIPARKRSKVRFSLDEIGEVESIRIIKLHYVDGTIFQGTKIKFSENYYPGSKNVH